ncbi:MAG: hypothetical protein ACP5J8_02455 [Minisyncoccia bacterium]
MIIQDNQQFTYENLGYNKKGVNSNAPIFGVEAMTYRDVKAGENIISTPSNLDAGVVQRGSLSIRAKASPIIIHLSDVPYQVSSAMSKLATNLIVAESGTTTQSIDGWVMYEDFPIKDRKATYNSTYNSSGIALDSQYVYFAAGTNLYRMPLNFSGVTQITGTISAINGLTSDGNSLYTVNGTSLYKISISGTTFTVQTITLGFNVSKLAAFNGKYFIGYDATNNLLRVFQKDGTLWRNLPYLEPTFLGGITYNGFFYVATQLGSTNDVQLLPLLI